MWGIRPLLEPQKCTGVDFNMGSTLGEPPIRASVHTFGKISFPYVEQQNQMVQEIKTSPRLRRGYVVASLTSSAPGLVPLLQSDARESLRKTKRTAVGGNYKRGALGSVLHFWFCLLLGKEEGLAHTLGRGNRGRKGFEPRPALREGPF